MSNGIRYQIEMEFFYEGKLKQCGEKSKDGCKQFFTKNFTNFQKNKNTHDQLDIFCKSCRSFLNKKRYQKEKKNKPADYEVMGYNGLSEIYC